jgi:hypothetical protein
MPSIDRGVQSFIWAVVFFLFLYFGMVAIAVSKGTAFVLSLVAGFLTFLIVRTRGGGRPARRVAVRRAVRALGAARCSGS